MVDEKEMLEMVMTYMEVYERVILFEVTIMQTLMMLTLHMRLERYKVFRNETDERIFRSLF